MPTARVLCVSSVRSVSEQTTFPGDAGQVNGGVDRSSIVNVIIGLNQALADPNYIADTRHGRGTRPEGVKVPNG